MPPRTLHGTANQKVILNRSDSDHNAATGLDGRRPIYRPRDISPGTCALFHALRVSLYSFRAVLHSVRAGFHPSQADFMDLGLVLVSHAQHFLRPSELFDRLVYLLVHHTSDIYRLSAFLGMRVGC